MQGKVAVRSIGGASKSSETKAARAY